MTTLNETVLRAINNRALKVLAEPKVLASGHESYIFVDMPRALENYKDRASIAKRMSMMQANKKFAVCGIASGGIPLSVGMADYLKAPHGYIKKDENEVDGMDVSGRDIHIVEDVTTTAGSLLKGAGKIVRQGGRVVGVSVLVDRSYGELKRQYDVLKQRYPESYVGECWSFCTLESLAIPEDILAHEEKSFYDFLKSEKYVPYV